MSCDLDVVTLGDVYEAVGAPPLLSVGVRNGGAGCLVEQAVNATLEGAFQNAEALLLARRCNVTLAMLLGDVARRGAPAARSSSSFRLAIATDIDADMIDHLGQRSRREHLDNLRATAAIATTSGLAANSIDRILIVHVWHHIGARAAFAADLAAAVRPGGRVLIVDFDRTGTRGPPAAVRIVAETIIDELAGAGLTATVLAAAAPGQFIVEGAERCALTRVASVLCGAFLFLYDVDVGSVATARHDADESRMSMARAKKTPKIEQSPWLRVAVDCHSGVAETLSGLLMDEGALGLETEDDETRAVPGRALVLTGRSLVLATFSREPGLQARVAARLANTTQYVEKAKDTLLTWSDLWAEDWNAVFMAHWKPFRLGRRVWIVPSWERDRFQAERVGPGAQPLVLHLDPGMAFGTGTHETTQLCTEGLEEFLDDGRQINRLLDVGTGTGILALVALRLGAAWCKGTDIDSVAVNAAIANANDNAVGKQFAANADSPDVDGASYDAVVANILAGTLIQLREQVAGSVAPGGRLWLSGILQEQAPAVIAAYKGLGLLHLRTAVKGEWVRIDFDKPAA